MFGSTILEVAIGLVLIYLLMSLIMTSVQEAISGFFKTRASNLHDSLSQLLQNDGALVQRFYEHPFVAALYKGTYTEATTRRRGTGLPSYIPRDTFSAVMLDLFNRSAGESEKLDLILGHVHSVVGVDVREQRLHLEQWYDGAMDRASGWYKRNTQKVLLVIGFVGSIALNVNSLTIAQYLAVSPQQRQLITALAEEVVAATPRAPLPSGNQSGGDAEPVAGQASAAGNDQTATMPANEATPDSGNAAATPEADNGMGEGAGNQLGDAQAQDSAGAGNEMIDAARPALGSGADTKKEKPAQAPLITSKQLNEFTDEIRDIGLPIGWQGSGLEWVKRAYPRDGGFFGGLMAGLMLLAGYLITALAIMLGAPFWFDVLNKFMVVRATVKPKEKSPDEASEDRTRPGGSGPASANDAGTGGPSARRSE